MPKFQCRSLISCDLFVFECRFPHPEKIGSLLGAFSFLRSGKWLSHTMAIILSKGVISAICAVAGCLVLATGSFLVIKLLRLKYERLHALTRETSEQRSSRYSGGNFQFTDADFARTPGTRTKLRRSINNPYSNPRNDWASIPSCDNLPRRVALPRSQKALVADQVTSSPNREGRRWPVPPRLKRSNAIPLSALQTSPPVRLIERSPKAFDTVPSRSQSKDLVQTSADKRIEHNSGNLQAGLAERLVVDVPSEATTKPKPLFYGKQRSISTSAIRQGTEGNTNSASMDASRTTQLQQKYPPQRQSSLPRSSSLFTQPPGKAPSIPMPKLPSEVSARIQNIKIPANNDTKSRSHTAFVTEYTALAEDGASRALPHTDHDVTSIGLQSLLTSGSASVGLGIDLESGMLEKTSTFLGSQELCTQMASEQSFATSVQQSLPRDNSSGLRFSMYDHSRSRNESGTTLSKDLSPKLVLKALGNTDRRSLGQQTLPSDLLPTHTKDCENAQSSQLFASVLKDVSGNEGSPLGRVSRPSSIVAGDPFQYDPGLSMQPEKSTGRTGRSRHNQRQSCVPPTKFPTIFPVALNPPNMDEGLGVTSAVPPRPKLFGKASVLDQAMSRPPSKASFSPRILNTKQRHSLTVKAESTDSLDLSMLGPYKQYDSPSGSLASTPTRKPSGRNPSIIQLGSNYRSNLQGWDPYDPETAPNLAIFPDITIPHLPPNQTETSPNPLQRSPLKLPDPLKPPESTSCRKPPLHGPRALPRRTRSPARRSPTRQHCIRRSPSRSPTRHTVGQDQSSSNPNIRNKQLINTIIDLRRMNSEVSKSGGEKAHRRFRSLGSAEHTIDGGEVDNEQRGDTGRNERPAESVRTPRHTPDVEIPELLFSTRRNEDGVWEAPKWAIGHGDDGLYGEDGFLLD